MADAKTAPAAIGRNLAEPADPDSASRDPAELDRPNTVPLTVNVVRTVAGVAALEPEFARLQGLTRNTLPFALYEWQLAWCRHFLGLDSRIADQPLFHVMRNADGVCVAIIPLIFTQRRLGTVTATSLGLLGSDPAITEIRRSLIEPGYEDRVAAALLQSLDEAKDWDWIQWTGECDAFRAALDRLRTLNWQPAPPGYLLDLPATWDEFRAALKRNIRESLRHCYNSLKRHGHRFELRIAASPHNVRSALDRLFELHRLRAEMSGTVDHPDRFAGEGVRQFVYDVCNELAARNVVRVFQIEIAGNVVASRIGFAVEDSLYLYYSGFDPKWSRFSVMTTTVAEAIKYAIEQRFATVNLSPGTDVSKTRWGPREVVQQTAYEHSGRLRSRLVRRAYVKARSGKGLEGWLLRRLIPGRRTWN